MASGQEDSHLPENMVTQIVDFSAIGIEVLFIGPEAPEWASDVMK